jgi:hypothetical protein
MMTGEQGPVIAYTTEDDQHAQVRLAAVQHAREHGCVVILYAADAASAFSEPLPNQWASEGEDRQFGDRLTISDLEFLGREPLATQVREATAGGVEAFGWLPKDHGPGALADYARSQAAHRIFVPEALESIDELSALLGGETGALDAVPKTGVPVETVPASS